MKLVISIWMTDIEKWTRSCVKESTRLWRRKTSSGNGRKVVFRWNAWLGCPHDGVCEEGNQFEKKAWDWDTTWYLWKVKMWCNKFEEWQRKGLRECANPLKVKNRPKIVESFKLISKIPFGWVRYTINRTSECEGE